MTITLENVPQISVGDIEVGIVVFEKLLRGSEKLTGTPTVVEQTTSDLTIQNAAVTTQDYTVDGRHVPSGEAVLFKVLGQVLNTTYTLLVTTTTDGSPARTINRQVSFIAK